MTRISWDNIGDRVYESGVDRGVLYLPNGTGVPWNGLTSVTEKFDVSVTPTYYEGRKSADLVTLGDFSGTLKAITYPDEFVEIEGYTEFRRGASVTDQYLNTFGLSYRTMAGNDLDEEAGYKLHILYNLTATPNDQQHSSISDTPNVDEFEWSISAIAEDISGLGYRPTAHIVLDSRRFDPSLILDIEDQLYGTDTLVPTLVPMVNLIYTINVWNRLTITDNGDGTWTATTSGDHVITHPTGDPTRFEIDGAIATYLDPVTYQVSDTPEFTE